MATPIILPSAPERSRRVLFVLLAVPCLFAACADRLPAPADPNQGAALLAEVLDAWKRGDTPDALASARPAVRVADRDWSQGFRLVDYRLVGEPGRYGLDALQAAELELEDNRGRTIHKEVNYLITTGDQPMVARQDLDE